MRFFSLFEAQIIKLEFKDNVFQGSVLYTGPYDKHLFENMSEVFKNKKWEDEEFKPDYCQDFYWDAKIDLDELKYFKKILDFVYENKLNDNDKIMISEKELKDSLLELGWNQIEIDKYFDKFFFFEINMVDDGKLTDTWFFHL